MTTADCPLPTAAPADYRTFLEHKIKTAQKSGLDVDAADINPLLKPHVQAVVRWALAGGRRAIFASFGLHKTSMQVEIMRLILQIASSEWRIANREEEASTSLFATSYSPPSPPSALIIAPLGVRQEFFREVRERFSGAHAVTLKFIRRADEIEPGLVHLTNYETVRDGKLDPNLFLAVSLDEASGLRSFGSKTYQTFLSLFAKVRYKFVATATPSPNRYKELIHYAGFLGVMDTGQALTRFFQRNSEKAGDLTLYPHKEHEFWLWVASWGLFLQKPSDLGFSDDGYVLPPLKLRWHEVKSDLSGGVEKNGQTVLMSPEAKGLSGEAKERRDTLAARIGKAKEIRDAAPDEHFLLWHDLEDERRAIEAAFPTCKSIFGTQDLDEREDRVAAFSDGTIKDLAAKPIIAGSGCNFQRHCRRAIFVGVGHKFNDLIQAIHRIYRFGQQGEVEVDIIFSERERHVRRDIEAKWQRHTEMVEKMSEIIRHYGLNAAAMTQVLARSIGVERIEAKGQDWRLVNNDCVEECRRMPESSVDLVVTSIPFANHYEYTPKYNDFGHTDDNAHFFAQLDFLTPELLRVLAPGRLACIHVKDRIEFGSVTGTGMPTVDPFHAFCIAHYLRHGFLLVGMITVVTDVVRENNQTYRLGYTEMRKDATKMGVGCPEYILLLRKPQSDKGRAYADVPVTKSETEYSLARWQVDAHAFWRSSGNRVLTPDEMANLPADVRARLFTENSLQRIYDFDHHVAIGEALEARGQLPSTFMSLAPGSWDDSVWHDVLRFRTLNGAQAAEGREKHLCPLQFDIVDRLITRYSNKGDLVFDPFGGLGTVPVRALKLGRRGASVELSASYFLDAVKYCQAQEEALALPDLFASLGDAA